MCVYVCMYGSKGFHVVLQQTRRRPRDAGWASSDSSTPLKTASASRLSTSTGKCVNPVTWLCYYMLFVQRLLPSAFPSFYKNNYEEEKTKRRAEQNRMHAGDTNQASMEPGLRSKPS
jgi:hypothetical protein